MLLTAVNSFAAGRLHELMKGKKMKDIIFDTHAHYDMSRFDADREALLSSLPEKGVCAVINCGTNIESSQASIALAEKYDYFYAACGIYPHDWDGGKIMSIESILNKLRKLSANKRVVAIGEIGLDYRYDGTDRAVQKEIFIKQLELAEELNLPVILHDGEAHGDMMDILRRYKPRGVLHCFSGSVEMMREVTRLGLYVGIGGALTFKNAVKRTAVVKSVPEEYLLFETDAPYMAPGPCRGQRCDSSMIAFTAERAAEIRGVDKSYILEKASENACRLFKIKL